MGNGASVARSIRLFADRTLSPAALSARLAATAIKARDDLVRKGDAAPHWTTRVDGRTGVPETQVRPDGAIMYRFNVLGLAATFALTYCIGRSPVRSGRYRKAWLVAVDGRPWTADLNDIPPAASVMIVNPMPYARKIDVGAMRMSVPPGIVEGARQVTRRRFPTLDVQRAFVSIPPGLASGAPYIIKGSHRRKDRSAGRALTYPALIISERV